MFRQLSRLKCYVILSNNDSDLSDPYVDLSDFYVYLSDDFVVICMTLTGQEHVFKISFSTNE